MGKGAYTVFLSADHGAAHNAAFLADNGLPGGYWQSCSWQKELNSLLSTKYKVGHLVLSFSNNQVHLNEPAITKNDLDEAAIRKDCVSFLSSLPEVAFVVDVKNLEAFAVPQVIKERIINGYNANRSGAITFILDPGWYAGTLNGTGTTHGSWNAYDAHIPLLWMGWGIYHGSTVRQIGMTDIAPTLAALLHIQAPNGCIGKAITEVIRQP